MTDFATATLTRFPKLSIITPSFNQGRFIEKTIRSVIDQGYPNLEYIIIDGGSSDETNLILEKYSHHFAYCVSEPDRGQSHALNKGFIQASGEILAWINSDDWYEPGAFLLAVKALEETSSNVVIGNCRMVYENHADKNFIDKPGPVHFRRMLRYWQNFFCPPQPAIFFRKSILNKVGPVDESLNYAMDLDLWLRMASYQPFAYVDQTFANYLIHSESKSGSGNGFEKFNSEWRKVARRHLGKANLIEYVYFYKAFFLNR